MATAYQFNTDTGNAMATGAPWLHALTSVSRHGIRGGPDKVSAKVNRMLDLRAWSVLVAGIHKWQILSV